MYLFFYFQLVDSIVETLKNLHTVYNRITDERDTKVCK